LQAATWIRDPDILEDLRRYCIVWPYAIKQTVLSEKVRIHTYFTLSTHLHLGVCCRCRCAASCPAVPCTAPCGRTQSSRHHGCYSQGHLYRRIRPCSARIARAPYWDGWLLVVDSAQRKGGFLRQLSHSAFKLIHPFFYYNRPLRGAFGIN
jgi:hypothetical protein